MIRSVFLFLILIASAKSYIFEEECMNYTIYPVQYELNIYPYIYNNQMFYYDCNIIITVIANAPNINIITLDAKDLEIKDNSIQVVYDRDINIVNIQRPHEFDKKNGKLYIYLREYLRQYSVTKIQYKIKLSFRKYVKNDSEGVFVVTYDDQGPKYLFVTRLSPNKAKYFFPCLDNPQFEAGFKVRVYEMLNRPGFQFTNTTVVISSEQKQTTQNNYVVIDYAPSPQVGVHQFGFHHSTFGSKELTGKYTNDTLIAWAPVPTLQYYTYILEFGIQIIDSIHKYSKINRPLVYGPINLIGVPAILDGYEIGSWNHLTNGDIRLAYVHQLISIQQMYEMKFELTQQLCRIWLGNPGEIERTRWKEEWFKEGVATYLAYYFLAQYEHYHSTYATRWPMGKYGLHMKQKAMANDWHHSTPALINFNQTLAIEIPSRYKELVESKTASLLWMVENWIGTDKFHMALVKYINSRRGKFISLFDFMQSLDKDTVDCLNLFFSGKTSSKILYSWLQRSGYPVIKVEVFRDRTPNAIQLKQTQFSFNDENRKVSAFLIPISYITQNNENCMNCFQPKFTISETYEFKENLNGGWIILNRNASGYYRVNYDSVTWGLIVNTLKNNHRAIDEQNRAQIVDDTFALYVAGDIDYWLAMEILDYLDAETSEIVWEAVISGFDYLKIDGANCNMTKSIFNEWKKFMSKKVTRIYSLVINNEHYKNNLLLKKYIVDFSCYLGYQPCIDRLRQVCNIQQDTNQRKEPHSRQACYYWEYETNNFNEGVKNRYDLDDRKCAEKKWHTHQRFLYRIPVGELPPMIIKSTAPPPSSTQTSTDITADKQTSSSVTTVSAVCLILISVLLNIAFR